MALTCVEQEVQCVVHWFASWSELQRQDFLNDLVEKVVPHKVSTLFDAMEMLNMSDKPPSIFKCQIKLFNQWFEGWTDKERNDLVRRLEEIDPAFVARFNDGVAATSGQP